MRSSLFSGSAGVSLPGSRCCFACWKALVFAPLAALVGKWLLGRTVLDSTAIVAFLLSPRGFIALLLAAMLTLSIRMIEHAGLSAIFFGAASGRRVSSLEALRLVWLNLLLIVRVVARFTGTLLLTALPLVAVAGGFAARLLPRHDVNYYLKLRPPEFIAAAAVIGVVALVTVAVVIALVVRWRWVVQVVLFEQRDVRAAFAESAALTRDRRWRLAGVLVGVSLFALATQLLASVLGDACSSVVLAVAGAGAKSLAISFGLLLLLRTILVAVCTFLGSCVDAGVFTSLYQRRRAAMGGAASLASTGAAGRATPTRWLPVALGVGLLAFAVGSAWLALEAIAVEQAISIHAHRGDSTSAPENTLAAVRAAIAAGADYMETDVQLSRDDVLVITHDSDFSRLGGVAKKVWDLNYEEIRAIPLGSRAAPEYRNEIAPTLDALLAEAKGRIKLNIELKYYGDHQPELARKVVEAVRARRMLDQVVIQSLAYEPLMDVRRLAPGVPVGYLLSFNARVPARLDVDFLSVEQGRLDRAFIVSAHRRGQQVYAWTVNTAADMVRLFDLGIDGVITDQPAMASIAREQYLGHTAAERAVRRVRAWLAD